MENPAETQALIEFGQTSWAYLVSHAHVILNKGVYHLCSVLPATETVVCVPVEIIVNGESI